MIITQEGECLVCKKKGVHQMFVFDVDICGKNPHLLCKKHSKIWIKTCEKYKKNLVAQLNTKLSDMRLCEFETIYYRLWRSKLRKLEKAFFLHAKNNNREVVQFT